MDESLLNIKKYNYKSWGEYYSNDVDLTTLNVHKSWDNIFKSTKANTYIKNIEKFLTHCLEKTNRKIEIFPYPELLFSSFNYTPLNEVNVVILGQDPYFKNEKCDDKYYPQAMGMSFSVPVGIAIPSSLKNIYNNLLKFKHIDKIPQHGNLTFWAYQGVLMLNSSLTVQSGYPNSHENTWKEFTDYIIEYISDNKSNIVFVLWGAPSLSKLSLINQKKHKVIISSHPSGLSCNKPLKQYPAFVENDHFGQINDYLSKNKKKEIIWKIE